jgi:hypothetical protein
MLRLACVIAISLVACGGDAEPSATTVVPTTAAPTTAAPGAAAAPTTTTTSIAPTGVGCADVIDVTIEPGSSGFNVSATVSSADEGWDKYADAWQVRTISGTVLGERILTHPHENEQPFTRSLSGVDIPPDVAEVVVAARDTVVGFCGAEFVVEVPHP